MFLFVGLHRNEYFELVYHFLAQQDKVNTADSAFIFLIILLISQNKWSGWSGRRRWSCLVWSLLERSSQDGFDSEYIGFDGSPDD